MGPGSSRQVGASAGAMLHFFKETPMKKPKVLISDAL